MALEEYTIQDIKGINEFKSYNFELNKEENQFKAELQYKLDTADLFSPWISVEYDLPYNHEELIYEKDSRFTKSVLVRCIKITTGEELYKDAIMSKYCSENWFWATINDNYKVTHWMSIPKLPKCI